MARAVMRTNENPNLPVPAIISMKILANNFKKSQNIDKWYIQEYEKIKETNIIQWLTILHKW